MTDFSKTNLAIVLTAVISSATTTANVNTEIKNLTKVVDSSIEKLDRVDERVWRIEIKQGAYLAAN